MTRTRVNEIDLLRFFAVLAVVFFHYSFRGYAADSMSVMPYPLLSSSFKYGYLGVELFFMISGFVILMTAANGSLRGFIVSRIVRLYPAFWACCTITFLVTMAIGAPRYSASVSRYLVNMTMMSGFVGVTSIDGAYWSLFVEIKFYALVALVLLMGRIHQSQIFLILWLIASIMIELLPIDMLRDILIVDFSAFFIAGATYFLIWSQGLSPSRVVIVAVSWGLAVFQSVNGLSGFERRYSTTMSSYVVVGIITAFFLVMLLVSLRRAGVFGRNRWLFAGVITYPLYLLHQNIGFMIFNLAYPAVNPHILLWSTIIVFLGVAYVVHIYVEKRCALPMKIFATDLANRAQRLTLRRGAGEKTSQYP